MKRSTIYSILAALLVLTLIFFIITCSDESTNNDKDSICEKGNAQYLGNNGMTVTIDGTQYTASIAEAGNGPDFFLFYFAGVIGNSYFEIVTQVDKTVGSYELGGSDNASISLTISNGTYENYSTSEDEATGCFKITQITGEENVKGAFFFTGSTGSETIEITNGSFSIPIVN